ncbi:protein FANTASTIC FOUR 1-like [Manihot esculenta]|uniref:Uncharacterized protein n=2 Tax=Manihot esculenta TaxID=3983 RepID=A0ACB7I7V8_MANES|nr:protein FANTASTIC FOUR 1-like [Manihot esculenta]KAG8660426.1 hypothetical protein MANES_02G156700v8 [Manihot esculenta]
MDFYSEKGFFCKAKSVALSVYGFISWSITLPSTMQIQKQHWPTSPGLKTLIYSPEESPQNPNPHRFVVHSYMISSLFFPPSPSSSSTSSSSFRSLTSSSSYSSWSSMLDDVIGTESGVYLDSISEEETEARMEKLLQPYHRNLSKRNQQPCEMRKKYPPPIPLLARTGNLPGHMPWNLTRHYSNGRLILKEQRVKHHEYFEAYRENGRLILNLVPLDDTVRCCHSVYDEEEEIELQDLELVEEEETEETYDNIEEEEEETEADEQTEDDKYLEDKINNEKLMGAASASSVPKSSLKNVSDERPGDVRKCLTYAGRKTLESYYLSCNANAGGYIARSGSAATLSFTIRPMTTVV